jgi:hypothetical protein
MAGALGAGAASDAKRLAPICHGDGSSAPDPGDDRSHASCTLCAMVSQAMAPSGGGFRVAAPGGFAAFIHSRQGDLLVSVPHPRVGLSQAPPHLA